MGTLIQDLRYGLRMLRISPGFTVVAILTLALGIGANTAIFSVVNAVLFRPLPYPNPGQLALLPEASPKQGITDAGMSYPSLLELRDNSRVFSAVAGLVSHSLTLTGRGEPSEARTIVVTQDFFSVFDTKPLLGRTLLPGDGERGRAPVAVLSEGMWRSQFGADPNILGSPATLDMRPYTVVGVMPAEFRTPFFDQADQLWIPLVQDPLFSGWMTRPQKTHWLPVFARLRPEVSFAQAKAEMEIMTARLAKEFPAENGWMIQQVQPLRQAIVGDVKSPLLILSCAVGLVLLIACANIANLLLTRATSRSREIAVRIALGAPQRRITRQLLTESAILGIFGSVAGMFLAYFGVSALISASASGIASNPGHSRGRMGARICPSSVSGCQLCIWLGAGSFRRPIRSADKSQGGRSRRRSNRLTAGSQRLGRRRSGAGHGSSCSSGTADAQLHPAYCGQPRF